MARKRVGVGSLNLNDPWVEITEGVKGPKRISDVPLKHLELDVTAEISFNDDSQQYEVDNVQMRRRPAGPPFTAGSVRRFHALADSLSQAIGEAVAIYLIVDGKGFDAFYLPEGVAGHGPTPEALRWTARIYRVAYAVGWDPRQQVALTFHIPADTASAWIRKARAAGLLGATTAGRAAV